MLHSDGLSATKGPSPEGESPHQVARRVSPQAIPNDPGPQTMPKDSEWASWWRTYRQLVAVGGIGALHCRSAPSVTD
jgi:hypothetical protein